MSQPRHPSEEVLAEFASGALPPGASLAVSAHTERCPWCTKELALLEAIGGASLADMEPVSLSAGSLDAVLARIQEDLARPARTNGPRALRGRVLDRWIWVGGGLKIASVRGAGSPDERVYLVHGRAGSRVPPHGHEGRECVTVLKGSFYDRGVRYDEGDFIESGHSDVHELIVDDAGDCLCLIVTKGRLKFFGIQGLAARLLGV